MDDNIFDARIMHKADTYAKWEEAVDFIPMLAEMIVYLPDENNELKLKFGDGVTPVADLPFFEMSSEQQSNLINIISELEERVLAVENRKNANIIMDTILNSNNTYSTGGTVTFNKDPDDYRLIVGTMNNSRIITTTVGTNDGERQIILVSIAGSLGSSVSQSSVDITYARLRGPAGSLKKTVLSIAKITLKNGTTPTFDQSASPRIGYLYGIK